MTHTLDEDLSPRRRQETKAQAVILAGGLGTRLRPYTAVLPKPLMPIGDRAILEIVVEQLVAHGIRDITFCVGYLSHLIEAVLERHTHGEAHISYVREEHPLGTAAPLREVERLDDSFIVMNGDLLTTIDYRDLVRYHRANDNAVTIATHNRLIKIDYGVLHLDGDDVSPHIVDYEEKPEIVSAVSMGIYVLEPWVRELIPRDQHFDFPDLVHALLSAGHQVGAYRHRGLWFDIGRQDDYTQAAAAWSEHATAVESSARSAA